MVRIILFPPNVDSGNDAVRRVSLSVNRESYVGRAPLAQEWIMPDQPKITLSYKDKAMIGMQGALMAIPYLGSPLAHFVFGPLNELRLKRIERTLGEIAAELGNEKSSIVANENFANLLEKVLPDLSRAVEEEKRQRFRDLLLNAAELPEESKGWEEAELAVTLLREIGTPGLAVLVAAANTKGGESLTLTSRPVPQFVRGNFDYDNPGEPQHVLPYQWPVVDYWARWLREKRFVSFSSHDARGGFNGVILSELGAFLVSWVLK